jgi:hypothetical protein
MTAAQAKQLIKLAEEPEATNKRVARLEKALGDQQRRHLTLLKRLAGRG